eukprot:TRINITY_DN63763_c0_g1_i1.p2 TRINITY_DN63763_c0_g1~~TRINITY_DN63763_c0_g1_i1.p2  ORF type:complete len:117 (+),score=8.41 TRINITY_DN63763_c0_g1_i1:80-430(+)
MHKFGNVLRFMNKSDDSGHVRLLATRLVAADSIATLRAMRQPQSRRVLACSLGRRDAKIHFAPKHGSSIEMVNCSSLVSCKDAQPAQRRYVHDRNSPSPRGRAALSTRAGLHSRGS